MKIFKLQKAAEFLSCHPQTLQRWDRSGKLTAHRTKTGRRFYTEEQLLEFLGLEKEDGKKT